MVIVCTMYHVYYHLVDIHKTVIYVLCNNCHYTPMA